MFKFNRTQKLELSKAIFNFGNIIGGTFIVNEAIFGRLSLETFIFAFFSFAACFTSATLLLKTERKIS